MSTDQGAAEPIETPASAAVDAPRTDTASDSTTVAAVVSPSQDEAAVRDGEGLPPEAVILVPVLSRPPMRCPDNVWAMLVAAVDMVGDDDSDCSCEVALFAGCWVSEQPPADGPYDGDLAIRLAPPADPLSLLPPERLADVEILLAYDGRWQCVGRWYGVDDRWPHIVAPTAAAVTDLHGDLRAQLHPLREKPSAR